MAKHHILSPEQYYAKEDALSDRISKWAAKNKLQSPAGVTDLPDFDAEVAKEYGAPGGNSPGENAVKKKALSVLHMSSRRAKKGGEVSEVNGQPYKGGRWMPIHGQSTDRPDKDGKTQKGRSKKVKVPLRDHEWKTWQLIDRPEGMVTPVEILAGDPSRTLAMVKRDGLPQFYERLGITDAMIEDLAYKWEYGDGLVPEDYISRWDEYQEDPKWKFDRSSAPKTPQDVLDSLGDDGYDLDGVPSGRVPKKFWDGVRWAENAIREDLDPDGPARLLEVAKRKADEKIRANHLVSQASMDMLYEAADQFDATHDTKLRDSEAGKIYGELFNEMSRAFPEEIMAALEGTVLMPEDRSGLERIAKEFAGKRSSIRKDYFWIGAASAAKRVVDAMESETRMSIFRMGRDYDESKHPRDDRGRWTDKVKSSSQTRVEDLSAADGQVVARAVANSVRDVADRHFRSSLRAAELRDEFSRDFTDTANKALEQWEKDGAPMPMITGFELLESGERYVHSGDAFLEWVELYAADILRTEDRDLGKSADTPMEKHGSYKGWTIWFLKQGKQKIYCAVRGDHVPQAPGGQGGQDWKIPNYRCQGRGRTIASVKREIDRRSDGDRMSILRMGEYKEEDHPRGKDGRWIEKDHADISSRLKSIESELDSMDDETVQRKYGRNATKETVKKALKDRQDTEDKLRERRLNPPSKEQRSENFDRWFGESKVTNEDGEPLVVYHGTSKAFSRFAGGYFYFSENPEYAAKFSFVKDPIRIGRKVTVNFDKTEKDEFDKLANSEIEVRLSDGTKKVKAIDTGVPGLFVNRSLNQPGRFEVTHGPSGFILVTVTSAKEAKSASKQFAKTGIDWSLGQEDLPTPKSPEMQGLRKILKKYHKKSTYSFPVDEDNRMTGEREVVKTDIPGLVIAPKGGEYFVVHEKSGYPITSAYKMDVAWDVVDSLKSLRLKWDRPIGEMPSTPATLKKLRNAISEGHGRETAAMFGYKSGAKGVGKGSNILPVYLKIENPLDLRDLGARKVSPRKFEDALNRAGLKPPKQSFFWGGGDLYQALVSGSIGKYVREAAKDAGYDGIVFEDYYDPKTKGASWIAFKPSQVKSASGNIGTFDEETSDLRMSSIVMPRKEQLRFPVPFDLGEFLEESADKFFEIVDRQ